MYKKLLVQHIVKFQTCFSSCISILAPFFCSEGNSKMLSKLSSILHLWVALVHFFVKYYFLFYVNETDKKSLLKSNLFSSGAINQSLWFLGLVNRSIYLASFFKVIFCTFCVKQQPCFVKNTVNFFCLLWVPLVYFKSQHFLWKSGRKMPKYGPNTIKCTDKPED